MVHPEWFLDENDELNFGETACRIPGGHILELASKAYEFDALAAFVRSHDPSLSEEEFDAMFPPERSQTKNILRKMLRFTRVKKKSKNS
ncbi:MAG: hypothetical protein U5K00_18505 [Melioribacteraceae bacterium]|nr:hypothetical protein [Melioribacteraceae bacterium]